MKSISAPFVPQLDELTTADDISAMLDTMGTRTQINSLNWPDQFPYAPLSTFTIAHTAKTLYIDFFVRCNYLRAENFENQSPVSDDSCVEFFVSPTCDNHYWNFEFNCIGTINASHRSERKNPTRLNAEQLASVRRYASCGTRPFREMEGMFAWNLLVAIPLDLIDVKYEGKPIEMMANFYKVAAATSAPHFLSWNEVHSETPDFHRPCDFGRLILE
jgi:hypothetical protein